MKKVGLFAALIVMPIVLFLVLASMINIFSKLPVVVEKIPEIPNHWKTNKGKHIQLKDKVTVLGFIGNMSFENKSNLSNVGLNIYQKNKLNKNLQVIYVVPEWLQCEVEAYIEDQKRNIDLSSWHYVFTQSEEIQNYYQKLQVDAPMIDVNTPYVFIVDKELKIRGRKKKIENQEYQDGYLSSEPTEILHNEMEDDLKIVLFEYQSANKKNYKTQESE